MSTPLAAPVRAVPAALAAIPIQHVSTEVVYPPERNPYRTVMVDVTHRCNMTCRNCYIPNRDIPDMDADWMERIIARFPRRTHIRLVGAEPTVRRDLPDLIRRVRRAGHVPVLMTNGLKLASVRYVRSLKAAGLRTVYLSLNGGFDDDAYEAVDDLRCAARKRAALDTLCAEKMYVSLGIILVRGVNEQVWPAVYRYALEHHEVHELHLRSVGPIGRFMPGDAFLLAELVDRFARHSGVDPAWIETHRGHEHYVDFRVRGLKVQLTQWPDLGSTTRGRLAPDGTLQPAFEHVIANEGLY
jgi:molybdenum cofactor biosynthesis enzyme MoaA